MPRNIPLDTVYLSLVNFRFDALQRANFSRYTAVQCLTIVNSGVKSIAPDTFSAMTTLHELILDGTQLNSSHLQFINYHNFKAELVTIAQSRRMKKLNIAGSKLLRELKTLDIHSNGLTEINTTLFIELRSLETLDLSDNKISHINWLMMHELVKLNSLRLNDNLFQAIPEEMHKIFFSVKELHLAGNPFHCNCKLRWLKEFFDAAVDKNLDYDSVECASPRATLMRDAGRADFTCQHPATPLVHWAQLDDGRYAVNCSSVGDPAPLLTLTFHDGQKVLTPPSSDLSELETRTPHVLTSGGPVRCEATNSEGTAVGVGDLPVPGKSVLRGPRSTGRPHPLHPIHSPRVVYEKCIMTWMTYFETFCSKHLFGCYGHLNIYASWYFKACLHFVSEKYLQNSTFSKQTNPSHKL